MPVDFSSYDAPLSEYLVANIGWLILVLASGVICTVFASLSYNKYKGKKSELDQRIGRIRANLTNRREPKDKFGAVSNSDEEEAKAKIEAIRNSAEYTTSKRRADDARSTRTFFGVMTAIGLVVTFIVIAVSSSTDNDIRRTEALRELLNEQYGTSISLSDAAALAQSTDRVGLFEYFSSEKLSAIKLSDDTENWDSVMKFGSTEIVFDDEVVWVGLAVIDKRPVLYRYQEVEFDLGAGLTGAIPDGENLLGRELEREK